MGALPLPKPKAKSRPAFKTYEYDREKLRKQTDYTVSPAVGWSPLYNAMLVDLPRLSRSISFMSLITWVLRHAQGLDSSRPTSTEPLPDEFLAACSAPDASVPAAAKLREYQRNVDYGTRAGIFTRKKVGQGYSVFSLRLAAWASLPDYKTWLASNLHEVDETENQEPDSDDPAQQDAGDWRLKAPIKVSPGQATKTHKIECGVKSFRVNPPKVGPEFIYDCRIKGGEFVLSLEFTGNPVPKTGETEANEKRHTRRDFTTPSPTFRQSLGEQKAKQQALDLSKIHPKASKLCEIFNPLLMKSQQPMLESNLTALQSACEALGDFGINELIEYLGKGRARRALASPRHVALIIGDAKRDAKARESMAPEDRPVTREQIDAMIEAERAAIEKAQTAKRKAK